ncbi:hypothetical protein NE237_006883 [Protea cynaroides]|uniref:Uncharacterized protein n=1 Tax=Protea cynaroides TaxID=273540 RepID=A0A9Q0QVY6_9MAGN|nr:hypothetical protein NE237_006883 [Protea cynaroides]
MCYVDMETQIGWMGTPVNALHSTPPPGIQGFARSQVAKADETNIQHGTEVNLQQGTEANLQKRWRNPSITGLNYDMLCLDLVDKRWASEMGKMDTMVLFDVNRRPCPAISGPLLAELFVSDNGGPLTIDIFPFIGLYVEPDFSIDFVFFPNSTASPPSHPLVDGSITYTNAS